MDWETSWLALPLLSWPLLAPSMVLRSFDVPGRWLPVESGLMLPSLLWDCISAAEFVSDVRADEALRVDEPLMGDVCMDVWATFSDTVKRCG